MGHRALVAYEKADGTVESHYSHWGAMNLMLRAPLREGACPGDEHEFTDAAGDTRSFGNTVDTEQYAEPAADLGEFIDMVDYNLDEAVYIVPSGNPEGTVAYRPVSYRFDARAEASDRHEGVLLSPRWYEGEAIDSGLLGRAKGMKLVLDDFLKYNELTHQEAKRTLDSLLISRANRSGRAWATVQMDDDTSVQISEFSPRAQIGGKPPAYRRREKSQRAR
jgi:hypothetical protein